MATKHDEFKVYYFSFDQDEIVTILAALRCHGEESLADEISDQVWEDGCGGSCEVDALDRVKKVVDVNATGEKWDAGDIDAILEHVYKQSKSGRIVVGGM